MEEETLLYSLLTSFTSVFRDSGTTVDVAYVLQMMRSAIVNRGLTKNTCIRLVDAIQIISKFGGGFLSIEELENGLGVARKAHDAAMQPVVRQFVCRTLCSVVITFVRAGLAVCVRLAIWELHEIHKLTTLAQPLG